MIVFPALCSAMLRRFLDSPLNIWSICYFNSFWCLWCDTNSFRACSLSTTLSVIRVYMYILIMCVSVLLCMAWGLQVGLCWLCTVTSTFEWGMDTYACTLVCDLCLLGAIRWHKVGRQGRYLGFCVCDVYYCSLRLAGGCCCIVQLGSTILCMLEFCSSLFIGYGTIHMLFIIICLLLSVCKQASVCHACVREHSAVEALDRL
jgi:hypothetical protein